MVANGYGKILDVDLSTGKIVKVDIDPKFAQEFIGGMGFGCKILYDQVRTEVDPLGADNIMIFANGPLTGTHAPCSGRTELTTKSPLPGSIGTGNTGGVWGTALKHAGFDLMVVRGKVEKPVYLWINDDIVEIREAKGLWGKDTRVTSNILEKELGPKVSVMAIGPAGENLVRYACLLNDYHHTAARCGGGVVMGAKRMKAIAVRGTGAVKIARPEEFREAAREVKEHLMGASRATRILSGVLLDWTKDSLERGCLPAKNFQTGVLPRWLETRGLDIARRYVTKNAGTCTACPISCFNLVEINEGKYAGLKVSRGAAPGVIYDWGAKLAIGNLPAIWKCKELCQLLEMDYA